MKAVDILHAQAGSITSRTDGSLKLTFVTPELLPSQAGALIQLHGKNVRLGIIPEDVPPEETVTVAAAREGKTPAARMRAVIFLLWKEAGEEGSFDAFYENRMNSIIEKLKDKLPQ